MFSLHDRQLNKVLFQVLKLKPTCRIDIEESRARILCPCRGGIRYVPGLQFLLVAYATHGRGAACSGTAAQSSRAG